MMRYRNSSPTSCVYDAFVQAGLPVKEEYKQGVKDTDVIDLLRKHGYKVVTYGDNITLRWDQNFFIMKEYGNGKGHLEYHCGLEPGDVFITEELAAVAVKF